MADSKITSGTVLGVGLIALGAFGIAYLWQRGEFEKELVREYMREAEILFDYTVAVSQKAGGATEADLTLMGQMEKQMSEKEAAMPVGVIDTVKNAIIDTLRAMGVYVPSLIKWGIAAGALYWLYKKFPPRSTPPTCPIDGLQFPTVTALDQHLATEHAPNPSPPDLDDAQNILFAQPAWINEVVAAGSGLGSRYYTNWNGLTTQEIMAVGITVAVLAAIAFPSLGPAAVLLLL